MLCRCTSTTILIVGSTNHTSIAMSMRRQTNQQTIVIISLDYHRWPGSYCNYYNHLYRFCVHTFEQLVF